MKDYEKWDLAEMLKNFLGFSGGGEWNCFGSLIGLAFDVCFKLLCGPKL